MLKKDIRVGDVIHVIADDYEMSHLCLIIGFYSHHSQKVNVEVYNTINLKSMMHEAMFFFLTDEHIISQSDK